MFSDLKRFFVLAGILSIAGLLQARGLTQLSAVRTTGSVFAVKVQGDYLYLVDFRGSASLFKTVDVSDPTKPAVLDSFFTAGFIVDFDVNGGVAYLAMADNEFGLRILDISDPARIAEIAFLQGGEKSGTFFQDGTLYVADGGGLSVFDATRPDTLVFDWAFNSNNFGDGIDTFVFDNQVYLPVNNTGLFIIDKNTHDLLGTVPSPSPSIGVAANQKFAFFTDMALGLIAVDVADVQNPVAVDTLAGNGNFSGDVVLQGSRTFFCDGSNGLRVVDISDPAHLSETTSFVTVDILAVRVVLQDSVIYLASGDPDAGGSFFNGVFLLRNDFPTAVRGEDVLPPGEFVLLPNYPNPFNPETTIRYELRTGAEVQLAVYNALGQKVRTLVSTTQPAGSYSVRWAGRNDAGARVSTGLYFYELRVGGARLATRKMLFLK